MIQEHHDISVLSNFKTKATARYYTEIHSKEELEGLKLLLESYTSHLFIGGGTNLLFAFEEYPWLVIKNLIKGFYYDTKTQILEAGSAESIRELAQTLEQEYGQNIWHRFIGLPWSVWGAVVGNAGCFWLEIEGNFLKTEVYNLETGEFEIFDKKACQFAYRESLFKKSRKYFVVRAWFDLSTLHEKYSSTVDNIVFREKIQPKWNSCWSFFQNPSKEMSAGKLIELVGMKGYVHKQATLSEQHANFLMTLSDYADFKDLLELINLAQSSVKQAYWIDLIPEVRIIHS